MTTLPDPAYMTDDPGSNMRHFLPSRKRRKPGDLFAFQMPDERWGYIRFAKDGCSVGFFPDVNLLYVYAYRSQQLEVPDRRHLTPDLLLLPPQLTNNLGWVRGYFVFVDHLPIQPGDLHPRHCFWSAASRAYYDEYSRPLDIPFDPIGTFGVTSYSMIDLQVSHALGIPHPHDFAND